MRPAPWTHLDNVRQMFGLDPQCTPPGADYGKFFVRAPTRAKLVIIANTADPASNFYWEHVSVSALKRCPTWEEMCYAKSLFWEPHETVMQLHPPAEEYVNFHPHCLHLWRPTSPGVQIPRPPSWAVGPRLSPA